MTNFCKAARKSSPSLSALHRDNSRSHEVFGARGAIGNECWLEDQVFRLEKALASTPEALPLFQPRPRPGPSPPTIAVTREICSISSFVPARTFHTGVLAAQRETFFWGTLKPHPLGVCAATNDYPGICCIRAVLAQKSMSKHPDNNPGADPGLKPHRCTETWRFQSALEILKSQFCTEASSSGPRVFISDPFLCHLTQAICLDWKVSELRPVLLV